MGIILLTWAAVLGGSFVVMALAMFPIPGTDAGVLTLPAVNWNRGLGLVNPSWDITRSLDLTGASRYMEYPPLYQWVVSSLMWSPTPRAAFTVAAVMNLLTMLAFARWLVITWLPTAERPMIVRLVVGLAALTGLASWVCYHSTGRPESLAMLIVACALAAARRATSRQKDFVAGLSLGLLAATQVVVAALAGLGWLAATQFQHGTAGSPWRRWLCASVIAAAAGGALTLIFPYPLTEMLESMMATARVAVLPRQEHSLLNYYVLTPNAPLYGPLFLLAVGWLLWITRARVGWRGGVLTLFTGGLVWWSSIRSPNRCYNVLVFAPLAFAVAVMATRGAGGGPLRRLVPFAVVVLMGASSLGYVWKMASFITYQTQGVNYEDAMTAWSERVGEAAVPLVSSSLWVLASDSTRIELVTQFGDQGKQRAERVPGSIFVQQQAYTAEVFPAELAKHELVWHNFRPAPRSLLGLRLFRSPPGYQFAVYRRLPTPTPVPSNSP